MDRAWAFATAIININTEENYTVNDVKGMDKKRLAELRNPPKTDTGASAKGGAMELSRRTGISEPTIRDYLRLLDLEPEIQAAVQEKRLPVSVGAVVGKLKEPSLKKRTKRRCRN